MVMLLFAGRPVVVIDFKVDGDLMPSPLLLTCLSRQVYELWESGVNDSFYSVYFFGKKIHEIFEDQI